MFEYLKERLGRLLNAPKYAAIDAASEIEAKLRADATTKRGNVPSFGKKGDIPIRAQAQGLDVNVTGPDWVLKKAEEKGQTEEWKEIVVEAFRRAVD